MPLLKRALQIIFKVASCPRQDILPGNGSSLEPDDHKLPPSLSLKTPTAQLFPDQQPSTNACEVFVRSMLLRAQYGGMKCDVQMLHSFAITWLKRFQSVNVPTSFACSASESALQPMCWLDFPRILHEKAREKSEELVTSTIVCPGGLLKLNPTDVCSAGIDFHCSSVVEYLLSQRGLYASLCEQLAQPKNGNEVADRDRISGQLKSLIWNYSSGINHRRSFGVEKKNMGDSISRAVWNEVLKSPFDDYTRKFVRDRLS